VDTLFNLSTVTVGADPEFFIAKKGEIISGHKLPLGSKERPRRTTNGSVQCDGMAVEINVTPSLYKIGFLRNCANVLSDLEQIVKKTDPEMYILCRPTARFTEAYLETVPETAKELGCNPDWNAYELALNERPKADGTLRTAGGHIHIGWGAGFGVDSLEHISLCAEVAKQLDYFLGIPSLEWDRDNERRSLYGKAGAFRPKPYGMEYRVLSPVWLLSIVDTNKVFDGVVKALRLMNDGRILDAEYKGLARLIVDHSKIHWRESYPEFEKEMAKL
jgi:hypothetical protein